MGLAGGKRAIVTGAGSGIGRASAMLFAAQGAKVLAVDRSESVHETGPKRWQARIGKIPVVLE